MRTAKQEAGRYLTPPEIARRYGVTTAKVIEWITDVEIEAVNLARRGCTRPRYHVAPEALEKFEARRAVVPKVAPVRRRRSTTSGKDYFQD